MINSLDLILKKMFTDAVAEVIEESGTIPGLAPGGVTFRSPDSAHLEAGFGSILNVFLADIRENRKLRKSDRVTLGQGSRAVECQAPLRLDCHYLVSAWSRDISEDGSDVDEVHRLLYAAAAALLRHNPLVPRVVFGVPETLDSEVDAFAANNSGALPPFVVTQPGLNDFYALDPILRDLEIPLDPLPPEGYSKIAEFWGLMGSSARWRPLAYFIATIPVERTRRLRGPEVRSIGTTFIPPRHPNAADDGRETTYVVGGLVQRVHPDTGELVPAPSAPVSLRYSRAPTGQPGDSTLFRERFERATADAAGRFIFDAVEAGPIQLESTVSLRVSASTTEVRELTLTIDATVPPQRFGQYDFSFPRFHPGP